MINPAIKKPTPMNREAIPNKGPRIKLTFPERIPVTKAHIPVASKRTKTTINMEPMILRVFICINPSRITAYFLSHGAWLDYKILAPLSRPVEFSNHIYWSGCFLSSKRAKKQKKPWCQTSSPFVQRGRDDRIRTDGLLLPKQTR